MLGVLSKPGPRTRYILGAAAKKCGANLKRETEWLGETGVNCSIRNHLRVLSTMCKNQDRRIKCILGAALNGRWKKGGREHVKARTNFDSLLTGSVTRAAAVSK
jgi:hypothetical protein